MTNRCAHRRNDVIGGRLKCFEPNQSSPTGFTHLNRANVIDQSSVSIPLAFHTIRDGQMELVSALPTIALKLYINLQYVYSPRIRLYDLNHQTQHTPVPS
jgi:hypothetical protein